MNEVIFENGLSIQSESILEPNTPITFFYKNFKLNTNDYTYKKEMLETYLIIQTLGKVKDNGIKLFLNEKRFNILNKHINMNSKKKIGNNYAVFIKNNLSLPTSDFFNYKFIKDIMYFLLKDVAVIKKDILIKGNKDFLKNLQLALLSFKIQSKRNRNGLYIYNPHSIMRLLQFDKENQLKKLKFLISKIEEKFLFVGENDISFTLKTKKLLNSNI